MRIYIIEGEYGIKAFDIICWTHPHLDHSKGLLSLLKNYSNEETKIVLPAELHIVKDCMKTESRNIFNYIQKITKRNSIKHGECNVVTEGKILEYFELRGKEKIVFRIISLSPISTRVLNMANICKQKTVGKCSHNFNEYSVALIVEINGYWFLFAGDMENSTITEIAKKYLLDNVVFVKIPHHGSDTSNKLVELFDKKTCKDMVCATTALIKKGEFNKLPNNDVLKRYKGAFGEVLCTSKSYIEKRSSKGTFGIIESEISVQKSDDVKKIKHDIILHGDATRF